VGLGSKGEMKWRGERKRASEEGGGRGVNMSTAQTSTHRLFRFRTRGITFSSATSWFGCVVVVVVVVVLLDGSAVLSDITRFRAQNGKS